MWTASKYKFFNVCSNANSQCSAKSACHMASQIWHVCSNSIRIDRSELDLSSGVFGNLQIDTTARYLKVWNVLSIHPVQAKCVTGVTHIFSLGWLQTPGGYSVCRGLNRLHGKDPPFFSPHGTTKKTFPTYDLIFSLVRPMTPIFPYMM